MIARLPQSVPDNICIVMMSAVGDAVHVLPVINALKRANSRTRITWVLQPGPATLVRGHRSGSQSFSGLLVATTIDAIGRSIDATNSRCHLRS